jgi:hypothetical protein
MIDGKGCEVHEQSPHACKTGRHSNTAMAPSKFIRGGIERPDHSACKVLGQLATAYGIV